MTDPTHSLSATPTLLLTRPRAQAERFADRCRARLGADLPIVISPLLCIVPTGQTPDLTGVSGIVATSENGLRALADLADVAGRQAWCVGDRTAEVAQELGMRAVSAKGAAADLVALIAGARPGGTLLHVRGRHARGGIAERLAAAGLDMREAVLYDQVPQPLSSEARALLAGMAPVLLPLFSPRSARLAAEATTGAEAPLMLIAISAATLQAWTGKPPVFSALAARPDAEAVLDKVATIFPPGLA